MTKHKLNLLFGRALKRDAEGSRLPDSEQDGEWAWHIVDGDAVWRVVKAGPGLPLEAFQKLSDHTEEK